MEQDLRKGRDVPDQTDIDPRAIKRMLPYVFILDAEDPSRPIYRLAGTALCERFGFELKGTGFLAHWEAQSGIALASLLRQALRLKQPVCLSSIGASADCGMVELETVLAPVTFGPGGPTRFVGMIQILSDASQLHGRPIAFQRLAASQMIREDEPLSAYDNLPPPRRRRPAAAQPSQGAASAPGGLAGQAAAVHFADEEARQLIATLGAGLTRPRPA